VSRAVAPPGLSDDTRGASVRGFSIVQGGVAGHFDSSRGTKCILTTILFLDARSLRWQRRRWNATHRRTPQHGRARRSTEEAVASVAEA